MIAFLHQIEETVIESLAWTSNSPIWEVIEKSGQEIPKFQDTALPGHLLYDDVSNESCKSQSRDFSLNKLIILVYLYFFQCLDLQVLHLQ